jgi:hypothetical protein
MAKQLTGGRLVLPAFHPIRLGLIIYEMIFGRPAYHESDRKTLFRKILNDPLPNISHLNPLLKFPYCYFTLFLETYLKN